MAICEKCGTKGFDMREMSTNAEKTMFIGPCCVRAEPNKLFESNDVQYGLEISSHMGVKAYVTYGGLTLEFKKTREEISQWMDQNMEKKEIPPVEKTQEGQETTLVN